MLFQYPMIDQPISSPVQQDLDLIWSLNDPKAAESAYRALLPHARERASEDSGYLIELYTQIARALAAQGKLQEARSPLEEAEKLLETQKESSSPSARIRWLLESGRLQVLEKTPSQARPHFVQAWPLAIESKEDFLAVDIALMMAMIEPQKLQQEWLARALQIAENSPHQKSKRWLGGLHMSQAWKLYEVRQFDACLRSFQKALAEFKVHGTPREVFVANWSIGKALRAMGRTAEALAVQNALLAELGSEGAKDGRLFEELAECLYALNRSVEAQFYFELAYRELSIDPWVVDNQAAALKRIKELGKAK